jgi:hypothetical protein
MEILNWILLIIFSLSFIIAALWYILRCNNQLDNLLKGKSKYQLSLLLVVVVFTIIYISLLANMIRKDHNPELILKVYSLFSQTSGVDNAPEPIHFKFFSILVSFIGSIVFSGLLISTFNNLLQRRISVVEKGLIRYKSLQKHDVIIGANELIFSVVQYLINVDQHKNNEQRRIVILSNHSPQTIKTQLGFLDNKTRKRIIIYKGDINDKKELSVLKLEVCRHIVILGDNSIEWCDSGNILIIDNIIRILKDKIPEKKYEKTETIKCFLSYWDDSFMLKYFQEQNFPLIHLFPFNFYEIWAGKIWGYGHLSKILAPQSTFQYDSLLQNKITPFSSNFVNIVLLGFNMMGMELLKTAIKVCHFANFDEINSLNKTQITIITDNKDSINLFKTRYSGYKQIPDISCSFIEISPFEEEAKQKIINLINLKNAVSTIAICSENSDRNYILATHLPMEVYEKEIPVVTEYHIFSEYIEKMHEDKRRYSNIRFFGFKNTTIDINYNLETAQFIIKSLDLLYEEKSKSGINNYKTVLPSYNFTLEKIETAWHQYKMDNRRQTILSYVDTLILILNSMGLQLIEARNRSIDDYHFDLLGDVFNHLRHRQMIAWNILAGYLPTDNIADSCNWKIGKINILFPLSKITKGTTRHNDVIEECHFHQVSLLLWLFRTGYYLAPIEDV